MILGWLYFNRPPPYIGSSLSGDLNNILSKEHYDVIRRGMTWDELGAVLDMGEYNRELIPWCKEEFGKLAPGKENWMHFNGNDSSIDVKIRGGRIVAKKLHRHTFNEPPLELHAWD